MSMSRRRYPSRLSRALQGGGSFLVLGSQDMSTELDKYDARIQTPSHRAGRKKWRMRGWKERQSLRGAVAASRRPPNELAAPALGNGRGVRHRLACVRAFQVSASLDRSAVFLFVPPFTSNNHHTPCSKVDKPIPTMRSSVSNVAVAPHATPR